MGLKELKPIKYFVTIQNKQTLGMNNWLTSLGNNLNHVLPVVVDEISPLCRRNFRPFLVFFYTVGKSAFPQLLHASQNSIDWVIFK